MRLHTTALLAVALAATSAFGSGLQTFKDWDQSPQGYFMTSEERAQWKAVNTDADAEKFVAEFLAKRDPKFATEVATRAQNADKYLSIGKTKGSQTLRGKIVILFGPPSGMNVENRAGRSNYVSPPSSSAVTDLGTGASASSADGDSQRIGEKSRSGFKDYTFTFSGKSVPGLGGDYSVTIEADAATGRDRVRDKKKAAELEEKFESVARASIKP